MGIIGAIQYRVQTKKDLPFSLLDRIRVHRVADLNSDIWTKQQTTEQSNVNVDSTVGSDADGRDFDLDRLSAMDTVHQIVVDEEEEGSYFDFLHLSHHTTLYLSLVASVAFLVVTLLVQYRLSRYESRETFFILHNLVIALLMIELIFLFGTTFHMDLFWIRVAKWSPAQLDTPYVARVKHILCLSVPIFLHFIHLTSLFWMLCYSILLYQRFWRQTGPPSSTTNEDHNHGGPLPAKISTASDNNHSNQGNIHHDPSQIGNQMKLTSCNYRKQFLKQTRSKMLIKTKKQMKMFGVRMFLNPVQWLFRYSCQRLYPWSCANKPASASNVKLKAVHLGLASTTDLQMQRMVRNYHHQNSKDGEAVVVSSLDLPSKVPNQKFNTNGQMDHGANNVAKKSGTCSSWRCKHFLCFSLGLSFILVLLSYLFNPRGYETKR